MALDARKAVRYSREAIIIEALLSNKNSLTSQELEDKTEIPYSSLTRILRSMEDEGIIQAAPYFKARKVVWEIRDGVPKHLVPFLSEDALPEGIDVEDLETDSYRAAATIPFDEVSGDAVEMSRAFQDVTRPSNIVRVLSYALAHVVVRSQRALEHAKEDNPGTRESLLPVEKYLSAGVFPDEKLTRGALIVARRELRKFLTLFDHLIENEMLWNGQAFRYLDSEISDEDWRYLLESSDEFQQIYLAFERSKLIYGYFYQEEVHGPTLEEPDLEEPEEDNGPDNVHRLWEE